MHEYACLVDSQISVIHQDNSKVCGRDLRSLEEGPDSRGLLAGRHNSQANQATDKKTGRQVESKIRSELTRENYGILQPKAKPTVSEFLKKSFLPLTETRFKEFPKTAIYYRQGVARLLSSQLAGLRLGEISNQHATQFEAQHGHYSASTINQALQTLRRAMRLAEEWGEVIRAPNAECFPWCH